MKQRLAALIGRLQYHLSLPVVIYWITLVSGLYLFVELAEEVYEEEGFWFDEPVLTFFAAHRTQALDYFFRSVTWLGSNYLIIPIGTTILIVLLRCRYFTAAAFLCLGYGGATLITYITKSILARHRPELFPHLTAFLGDLSFPSGHATQITAFVLSLFLIIRQIKPHWQLPVAIIAVMAIAAVSNSRIYLQVHYPSDILAGLLVATIWVLGVDGLMRWQQNRKADR